VGLAAKPDLVAAYIWTGRAATNALATPALRASATEAQLGLARRMRPSDIAYARRFTEAASAARQGEEIGIQAGGVSMILASSAEPGVR